MSTADGFPTKHNNLSLKHFSKKGGRIIDRKGYVRIMNTSHPFVSSNGYVPEHRLVWEEHNKAILLPWTDIHHINGVRDDNRIENLKPVFHRQHTIDHNPKDPEKCKVGRSRRKKRWWNKLRENEDRLAHVNRLKRINYWKNRDREIKLMRERRQKRKIEIKGRCS